jgi:hypothetical protein
MIKEIPPMNNHKYYSFGHSEFNFKAGVDIVPTCPALTKLTHMEANCTMTLILTFNLTFQYAPPQLT